MGFIQGVIPTKVGTHEHGVWQQVTWPDVHGPQHTPG